MANTSAAVPNADRPMTTRAATAVETKRSRSAPSRKSRASSAKRMNGTIWSRDSRPWAIPPATSAPRAGRRTPGSFRRVAGPVPVSGVPGPPVPGRGADAVRAGVADAPSAVAAAGVPGVSPASSRDRLVPMERPLTQYAWEWRVARVNSNSRWRTVFARRVVNDSAVTQAYQPVHSPPRTACARPWPSGRSSTHSTVMFGPETSGMSRSCGLWLSRYTTTGMSAGTARAIDAIAGYAARSPRRR